LFSIVSSVKSFITSHETSFPRFTSLNLRIFLFLIKFSSLCINISTVLYYFNIVSLYFQRNFININVYCNMSMRFTKFIYRVSQQRDRILIVLLRNRREVRERNESPKWKGGNESPKWEGDYIIALLSGPFGLNFCLQYGYKKLSRVIIRLEFFKALSLLKFDFY